MQAPHTSTNVIFILLGGADRNMLDAMVPLKLRVYAFQARLRKEGGNSPALHKKTELGEVGSKVRRLSEEMNVQRHHLDRMTSLFLFFRVFWPCSVARDSLAH